MQGTKSTVRRYIRGYTLIELAISIVVAGVTLATLSTSLSIYLKNEAVKTSVNNSSSITDALNNYLIQTGGYPCPARFDAKRSDADYGLAGGPAGSCTAASDPPVGTCAGGFCEKSSNRVSTGGVFPTGWDGKVRVGAVPFRTLGLPEEAAEDGYGMRFTYAVTEALTRSTTYAQDGGGIDIVDSAGNRMVAPPAGFNGGSVHYLIVSSGPDRVGSYNREGKVTNPCPLAGSTFDEQNCRQNAAAAQYLYTSYSSASGGKHFDDLLKFYSSVSTPLWKASGAGGVDIVDLVSAGPNTTDGKIGIGVDPSKTFLPPLPATTPSLQVAADAATGIAVNASKNLQITQICPEGNSSGSLCYNSTFDLTCSDPLKPLAIGFSNGGLKCVSADPAAGCPLGQAVSAINADGTISCAALLGCPNQGVEMCDNPTTGLPNIKTLTAEPVGGPQQTLTDGDSLKKVFQCTGSGWQQVGNTTGVCVCTPVDTTQTMSCAAYMSLQGYSDTPCTSCWTGSATLHTVRTCPDGTTTSNLLSSSCQCTNYNWSYSSACPKGQTGSIAHSGSWICDTATTGHWTSETVTNSCVCDSTATKTSTISCQQAGYNAGYQGSVKRQATMTCPANVWSSWSTLSDTCVCNTGAVTQTITQGCPSGQVGSTILTQQFDCATASWQTTSTSSNCAAQTFMWNTASAQKGPVATKTGVAVGGACSPSGAVSSCYSSAGFGQYWLYDQCICQ